MSQFSYDTQVEGYSAAEPFGDLICCMGISALTSGTQWL